MRILPGRNRKPHYTRLSPQDASFLAFETPDLHMHVGLIAIFEAASFDLGAGRIEFAEFQRFIESRLPSVPRCRQRLAYVPITGQPVWVDDARFRITEHLISHTLAAPGGDAELQALAGEIFSRKLDRAKPLWELHVVQGLQARDTFAVVAKVHHCMVDGIAGVDFMAAMLSLKPAKEIELAAPFVARPLPSRLRLLLDTSRRYATAPRAFASLIQQLRTDADVRASFRQRMSAVIHLVASGVRGTPPNPLSAPARAQRTIGWTSTDRAAERSVRARLASTRDDVTLACATGAARRFLQRKQARLSRLRVRAMGTVSLRTRAERAALGNRVGALIVDLPVAEQDPRRRLERVVQTVLRLKQSKQALGADVLAQIDQWTGTLMQTSAMWLANTRRAYNLFVTNIPGPPAVLYALDARLLAVYPIAPIFGGQHVSVATLSYQQQVFWGVHYAGDDPAEAGRFVADLQTSFAELVQVAAAAPPRIRVLHPATPSVPTDATVERRAGA